MNRLGEITLQHLSKYEIELDELAYETSKLLKLSHIQSISEPNVFWVTSISDLILRPFVIDFLFEHRGKFNRKLSINELLHYDCVISHYEPKTFNEFKKLL